MSYLINIALILAGMITYDILKYGLKKLFTRPYGENGKWYQGGRS